MWISDAWRDYALLDCGGGQRLERWGPYRLVRPDPQAIWEPASPAEAWRDPDARYHRSAAGGGRWENRGLPDAWPLAYRHLRFQVKPMSFKHTGIFPEQAVNWDFIDGRVRRRLAAGRPMRVLNLFAYTGAATLAAAAAGAQVCHVDAAKGMVAWARENAAASGLSDRPVRWLVDDCSAFLERELRRGNRYDALIMDPPSYGRGPTGQVWKLEDDLYRFVLRSVALLSDEPDFVLLSAYSTGLGPGVAGYVLGAALRPRLGGAVACEELGLPVQSTGLTLPCGCSARWTAD